MNQKINRRQILQGTALALGIRAASPLFMAVTAFSAQSHADESLNNASALNTSERKMVDILADLIIPKTDTPGAGDAGVPDFIDMMVSDWYRSGDRKEFINGLRHLNHHCLISFDKDFLECNEQQQIVALEDAEQSLSGTMSDGKSGGKSNRIMPAPDEQGLWGDYTFDGKAFFEQIKSLTVLGYYTSEVGIESELIYDPLPGSYDGSVDFKSVGKHYTS